MNDAHAILKQFWGYTTFRKPQEEVIQAVLEQRDCLALMPTGGGKSLCFQVPALLQQGVCIVVTPLIALMQDQVRQLISLGIKASAVHTGMSKRVVDITLDNCVYGDIKFLYVSPERLLTDLFQARVAKMKVNLLVVDEAHCISEWGYDFRPAYLEIVKVREILPKVPMLALTATATPEVRQDIVEKLAFKEDLIFQISFARKNLSYVVEVTEDKMDSLSQLLQGSSDSALVYVNTRRRARNIAQELQKKGLSASFYHGGLGAKDRSITQEHWLQDRSRVMVATNAFGMGINKPNVRLVVHYDLPDHLEGYYQEAGRAGRDGDWAQAVLLYQIGDIDALKERKKNEYPEISYLREIYQHLANHYQLAIGSAAPDDQDFDLDAFATKYQEKPLHLFHALKKLQLLGLIALTESFYQPSQFQFTADNQQVYEFQIANAQFDSIVKAMLRLYGGELFTRRINISEQKIASALLTEPEHIKKTLQSLQEREICLYQPRKDQPQLSFMGLRQDPKRMVLDQKTYETRRKLELTKLKSVQRYIQNQRGCRSLQLLEYFGESSSKRCGQCDICLGVPETPQSDFKKQHQAISMELMLGPLTAKGLSDKLTAYDQNSIARTIQMMLENGDLSYDQLGRLTLPSGLA